MPVVLPFVRFLPSLLIQSSRVDLVTIGATLTRLYPLLQPLHLCPNTSIHLYFSIPGRWAV